MIEIHIEGKEIVTRNGEMDAFFRARVCACRVHPDGTRELVAESKFTHALDFVGIATATIQARLNERKAALLRRAENLERIDIDAIE